MSRVQETLAFKRPRNKTLSDSEERQTPKGIHSCTPNLGWTNMQQEIKGQQIRQLHLCQVILATNVCLMCYPTGGQLSMERTPFEILALIELILHWIQIARTLSFWTQTCQVHEHLVGRVLATGDAGELNFRRLYNSTAPHFLFVRSLLLLGILPVPSRLVVHGKSLPCSLSAMGWRFFAQSLPQRTASHVDTKVRGVR